MAGKSAILSVRIIGDAQGATKAMGQTEKGIGELEKSSKAMVGKLQVAGALAGAALTKGLFDAVDADSANRKLAGQMNLSAGDAETAGRMAGDLYSQAYGDSLEDVNRAIGAVASTLADMSANGGADVERLSKKAMDLAGTFDVDVSQAVSTAGALMKNGLAADGDEAMDLLVGSLQKMPQAMQGELFPIMDEYSRHFADLGIDGTTALGMVVQSAQDGAIGMDKLGDSLKELTIRATDGSTATADAMATLGLVPEEMATAIATGGADAQEAFAKIVGGLQNIEDPALQAQTAVALFGTPLEDLGTARIPEFLGAIDPMGDAFDSVAGAADNLSETVNSGPGVALEAFKRDALVSLQEFAANAIPYIEPVLGFLEQFSPILGPALVAVAALAAATVLVSGAMSAWNAIMVAVRVMVMVATAAQWLWNAALSANPIGVVILLIAALVAGVIWAYNNVGWFRDAVDAMGAAAVAVWDAIVAAVQIVLQWLDDLLEPIGGIDGAMQVLKSSAEIVFGGINNAIAGTIGWVKDAIGWFQGLFGAKNDAASVDPGAGASDAGRMADPVAMLSGSASRSFMSLPADPYAVTAANTLAAPAALSRSLGSLRATPARAESRVYNVNVEFKGLTTDRVGVAREIKKILADEDALVRGGA